MNPFGNAQRPQAASLALLALSLGCGDTKPKVPASMNKLSDNQTAAVGTAVKNAPSVSILDADGKGISGITVTFVVATGGGSLAGGATATTNSAGIATAGAWTLGTLIGANTLVASATNVPNSPVLLTAIGVAGPAATLTKVSVDPDSAPTGTNIDSIAVKVADQYGNPVGGAPVTFSITSGGGSVSSATVLSNSVGIAEVRWTIGPAVGALNTATASTTGVSQSIAFNTVGRLAVWGARFSSSTFVVDSSASATIAVTALDAQGNPIANTTIPLTVRTTAAAPSGASVTGLRPGQSFVVGTPQDNPSAKDSAIVIVANVGAPVIRATVPRFDLKTDTVFTVPIFIDMRSSGLSAGAATLQISWDPTVLLFQSSSGGIASLTSNESNASTGSITMTFASQTGFANLIEVRDLQFKAAATSGKLGNLTLTVLDLASTTAVDLRLKTVGSFYPLRTR